MRKYTDYTPNRTTRTIQEEIALINALRHRSEKNLRKKAKWTNTGYKVASALLYATCAASVIYLAVSIYRK